MRYINLFSLVLLTNVCYSQHEQMTVYEYKKYELRIFLVFGCKVGYEVGKSSLFFDALFTHEQKGDKIFRRYDPEYSLGPRSDTLFVKSKNKLKSKNMVFKKASKKRKAKIFEYHILREADWSYYKVFQKRLEEEKDDCL